MSGRVVDLSGSEVRGLIETFLELFAVGRLKCVWVFGGTVREPERVHGDIDLLIEVPLMPDFADVEWDAGKWAGALAECPELALIDCFFLVGDKVGSFRYDLTYVELFDVTEKPKTGGLDDDDTKIYIGPKTSLDNL